MKQIAVLAAAVVLMGLSLLAIQYGPGSVRPSDGGPALNIVEGYPTPPTGSL